MQPITTRERPKPDSLGRTESQHHCQATKGIAVYSVRLPSRGRTNALCEQCLLLPGELTSFAILSFHFSGAQPDNRRLAPACNGSAEYALSHSATARFGRGEKQRDHRKNSDKMLFMVILVEIENRSHAVFCETTLFVLHNAWKCCVCFHILAPPHAFYSMCRFSMCSPETTDVDCLCRRLSTKPCVERYCFGSIVCLSQNGSNRFHLCIAKYPEHLASTNHRLSVLSLQRRL